MRQIDSMFSTIDQQFRKLTSGSISGLAGVGTRVSLAAFQLRASIEGDLSSLKPILDAFTDIGKDVTKDQVKDILSSFTDAVKDAATQKLATKISSGSLAGKMLGTIQSKPDGTLTNPLFVRDVLGEVEGGVSDAGIDTGEVERSCLMMNFVTQPSFTVIAIRSTVARIWLDGG